MVAVVGWLAVAVIAGALIGRMVALRDRQRPGAPSAPASQADPVDVTRPSRVTGRGRPPG